jgi:hypothetical protein
MTRVEALGRSWGRAVNYRAMVVLAALLLWLAG